MDLFKVNVVLDAKGLACPMPIVKTKKAMKDVEAGQVIEVQATDKGSKADIEAWANSAGHQYLGTLEEGDTLKHYLRKSSDEETVEKQHSNTATNEELASKLSEDIVVLDVRESAEYAFNHIPSAVSIPLGELEDRMNELKKEDEIYVVCRTGSRSDLAAQKLVDSGFENVINVLPGMSQWTGETTKIEN
ncbi:MULTISPECIES: sulfurtransferase TusA family protein [Bacillaceae]|uniref:sulfurtransferase TusA family protein n=1 Tax=Bacillaceae TaxID=186817 RepID=UPI000370A6DF|nr:sulfurtransferase TusA family protein [Gracilibacillus lacisalsi]